MYVRSSFLETESFVKALSPLKEIDFSFFFDCIPSQEEMSNNINIFAHAEINEYFGFHDWIIENQHNFSFILTWSDKVLNNCENAIYFPFGTTWLKPEQYNKKYNKEFIVSHVRGNLLKTNGHVKRFEYHDRSTKELTIPNRSWEVAGIREQIDTCAEAKCELFGNSQFGVAIENTTRRGYFTEKIIELFLLKSIPVYWGCSNIEEYFNPEGIIQFYNVDDAIFKLNQLTPEYYNTKEKIIEENYQKALQYISYEQNVVDKITKVFKLNNLI